MVRLFRTQSQIREFCLSDTVAHHLPSPLPQTLVSYPRNPINNNDLLFLLADNRRKISHFQEYPQKVRFSKV